MLYQYELPVYSDVMSTHPTEIKKGSVELAIRPMTGDEVEIEGTYHTVENIRIKSSEVILVLKKHYLDDMFT